MRSTTQFERRQRRVMPTVVTADVLVVVLIAAWLFAMVWLGLEALEFLGLS